MQSDVPRVPERADLLSSVLIEAGLDKTSTINVTGKDGLAALIWLCRHGFDHVGYVRSGQGGPHQAADGLLILHTTPMADLEVLLSEPGRLRDGGVLIVQTPDLRTPDGRDPIHGVLARSGYRVERCIMRHGRELLVARRWNRTLIRRWAA